MNSNDKEFKKISARLRQDQMEFLVNEVQKKYKTDNLSFILRESVDLFIEEYKSKNNQNLINSLNINPELELKINSIARENNCSSMEIITNILNNNLKDVVVDVGSLMFGK